MTVIMGLAAMPVLRQPIGVLGEYLDSVAIRRRRAKVSQFGECGLTLSLA